MHRTVPSLTARSLIVGSTRRGARLASCSQNDGPAVSASAQRLLAIMRKKWGTPIVVEHGGPPLQLPHLEARSANHRKEPEFRTPRDTRTGSSLPHRVDSFEKVCGVGPIAVLDLSVESPSFSLKLLFQLPNSATTTRNNSKKAVESTPSLLERTVFHMFHGGRRRTSDAPQKRCVPRVEP